MVFPILIPTIRGGLRRHQRILNWFMQIISQTNNLLINSRFAFLLPYNACLLVVLNKIPGVRLLVIRDVLKRKIGRNLVVC